METHGLTFEAQRRFWSGEREAVNFFARHDGVELQFIVTSPALISVGNLAAALNEETALLTFDNYEDVFIEGVTRVWRAAGDTQPVYFINDIDVKPSS
jgi:hypothetical protein